MQIFSYGFIYNPKAYSDWIAILKASDGENPIVIFLGTNGI